MTATDDRPTISERYSSATESSNLRVTDKRGDADLLIASGWLQDSLGSLLLRLRVEFDGVRAEVRRAPLNTTERLLILSQLKTLRETREELGRFAIQQATKRKYMHPDAEVLRLVGRALDIHLDPGCPHCDMRGFNGGTHRAEPQVICKPCHGTGHRKEAVGKDAESQAFGAFLLGAMERMQANAASGIAYALMTD